MVGAAENVENSAKIAVAKWGGVWYNGGCDVKYIYVKFLEEHIFIMVKMWANAYPLGMYFASQQRSAFSARGSLVCELFIWVENISLGAFYYGNYCESKKES